MIRPTIELMGAKSSTCCTSLTDKRLFQMYSTEVQSSGRSFFFTDHNTERNSCSINLSKVWKYKHTQEVLRDWNLPNTRIFSVSGALSDCGDFDGEKHDCCVFARGLYTIFSKTGNGSTFRDNSTDIIRHYLLAEHRG